MNFHAPIPILRIFDEPKDREFYVDWLGFKIDFEHRFEANTPIYMRVSRGDCVLHLSEHHGDGTPGTYVRLQVDELEEYLAELQSRPYKYFRPSLQDMEWGTREMVVYDGFGNRIIFYRPIKP